MSAHIDTYLWIGPADYARPEVRTLLDDVGFTFEFADDAKPGNDGSIKLDCREHESTHDLTALAALNVSCIASYDPRLECDGDRLLFASHGRTQVFIQEDGEGNPVVPVHSNGHISSDALGKARMYWRLRSKVKTDWAKPLSNSVRREMRRWRKEARSA